MRIPHPIIAAVGLGPRGEAEVPALDEFGPFEGRVNDIAFWIHPSVPFNSMAIRTFSSADRKGIRFDFWKT